jgi:hypothetical protein
MRFTIRDLLWLTVVVATLCGWFIHSRRLSRAVQAADARSVQLERFCESMGELIVWNQDRTELILPPPSGGTFP